MAAETRREPAAAVSEKSAPHTGGLGKPGGQGSEGGEGRGGWPSFAHPSEQEFAQILDFYQLEWQYEPHSFALREADDGRVVERFTPDFYLPELDLYIELTTLKQSLVTKKNRKLRRLRELYPDVKIKLLYNRDYRNLLFKYGLAAASKRLAPEPAGGGPAASPAPANPATPENLP